jgi:hypothetical protein
VSRPAEFEDTVLRTWTFPATSADDANRVRSLGAIARATAAVLVMLSIMTVACTGERARLRQVPATGGNASVADSVTEETIAPCHGRQLSGREVLTDGAAGDVWAPILLRNASHRACTLSGYPTIRFLDAAGHDLHLTATNAPDYTGAIPPSPIPRTAFVLQPGAKSWFVVHFIDVLSPCLVVNSMLVVPPGGHGTVSVLVSRAHEWDVCAGRLSVTAATLDEPLPGEAAGLPSSRSPWPSAR